MIAGTWDRLNNYRSSPNKQLGISAYPGYLPIYLILVSWYNNDIYPSASKALKQASMVSKQSVYTKLVIEGSHKKNPTSRT